MVRPSDARSSERAVTTVDLMALLRCLVPVALFSLSSLAAAADEAEVGALTGRPGIGDAAAVVPPGGVLVNPGLTVSGVPNAIGGPTGNAAPDLLVRVGLVDGLEARGGVVLVADDDARVAMSPLFAIGARVFEEGDLVPALVFLSTVTLPAGGNPDEDLSVEVRLMGAKTLGPIGVGVNVAANGSVVGGGWAATAGIGTSLPPDLSPFLELYADGDLFSPKGARANLGIDGGLGAQITRNVAVDVSAGITVVGEPELFVSAGASFLWP